MNFYVFQVLAFFQVNQDKGLTDLQVTKHIHQLHILQDKKFCQKILHLQWLDLWSLTFMFHRLVYGIFQIVYSGIILIFCRWQVADLYMEEMVIDFYNFIEWNCILLYECLFPHLIAGFQKLLHVTSITSDPILIELEIGPLPFPPQGYSKVALCFWSTWDKKLGW